MRICIWIVLLWSMTCSALAQCGEEILTLSDSAILSTYYWEEDSDSVLYLREFDHPQIVEGDSMVFTYICQTENFVSTIRSNVGKQTVIQFQVPMGQESFQFEGASMEEAKFYIAVNCYCEPPTRVYYYTEGSLNGRRLNKYEWQLSGYIPYTEGKSKKKQRIEISGLFPVARLSKK